MLSSGKLDIAYLGKIMEFTLGTLQKLVSPIKEHELKTSHQKLLTELAETCQANDGSENPVIFALIRGLRFVLEKIQVITHDSSLLFACITKLLYFVTAFPQCTTYFSLAGTQARG